MNPVIQLEHVSKSYKGKTAVDDLTLDIEPGSIVALLGPNGAGKSTTVSMTLGLQLPNSGTVKLFGKDPQDKSVRERIGAMLQEVDVIDGLKVKESVDLFRRFYDKPLPLEKLLRISGLEAEKEKMATALSGGQKRRLGFATALAGDPSLIFLDEPTVGMDVTSRQIFWETVRDFAGHGRTIILTTHYLDEADSIADRIVVINKGKLIADGTPTQIKANANGKVVVFTAGSNVTPENLSVIPGIREATWSGRRVKLFSDDTDALIFALVRQELDIRDIEIHSGGLEDAFQFLVQEAAH